MEGHQRPDRHRPHHHHRGNAGALAARGELELRAHRASAACAVPPRAAYRFLCDGRALGRWTLGSFGTRRVAPGLYRGRSLFDGKSLLVRPVGDPARLAVHYHVGTRADALSPRVSALVRKRRGGCVVSLVARRDPSMSAARWKRLVACHAVEVLLIQALLERK